MNNEKLNNVAKSLQNLEDKMTKLLAPQDDAIKIIDVIFEDVDGVAVVQFDRVFNSLTVPFFNLELYMKEFEADTYNLCGVKSYDDFTTKNMGEMVRSYYFSWDLFFEFVSVKDQLSIVSDYVKTQYPCL